MGTMFAGTAIHQRHISYSEARKNGGLVSTMVAVWTSRHVSPEERSCIMRLNELKGFDHIGVGRREDGLTAVRWLVRVRNDDEVRKLSIKLAKMVTSVTGIKFRLTPVSDYPSVGRALLS